MTSDDDLGASTRRVHQTLRDYAAEHGYAPSMQDLCNLTGITAKSTISWHLDRLAAAGLIARTARVPRGIRLLEPQNTNDRSTTP